MVGPLALGGPPMCPSDGTRISTSLWVSTPSRVRRRGGPSLGWRCNSNSNSNSEDITSSQPQSNASTKKSVVATKNSSNESNAPKSVSMGGEGPTKKGNMVVAFASATAAIGLFAITRGGISGATLGDLATSAIPYDEALSNGRPTVVEFYANWCEVCRELAPDVYKVEQQYKDVVNFVVLNVDSTKWEEQLDEFGMEGIPHFAFLDKDGNEEGNIAERGAVNFVMLNVDNTKWEEQLDEFGVEGIPHFAFLDKDGNEEGNIVGRLPRQYLAENISALAKGDTKVPHTRFVGRFSTTDSRKAPSLSP